MIGVFDSGFGGLTIFREIVKTLPDYDYVYLGDSARAPYGNHSAGVIYQYTEQAVEFLFKQGCELVILACNTATAAALRSIQQKYLVENYPERRVLGVIRPVIEAAVKLSDRRRLGVIGTRLTIKSQAFENELLNLLPARQNLKIYSQSCQLLVPLIEEGWEKKSETKKILRYYLKPLKDKKVEILILGCTHYPILIETIRAVIGNKCQVLNSGEIVAASLADYLERHSEISRRLARNRQRIFYTTDEPDRFDLLGQRFFKAPFKSQKISLPSAD